MYILLCFKQLLASRAAYTITANRDHHYHQVGKVPTSWHPNVYIRIIITYTPGIQEHLVIYRYKCFLLNQFLTFNC